MGDPVPADLAAAVGAAAPRLGEFTRLRYLQETGSTNDVALALASAGEGEGAIVLADVQHTGRGRLGRAWFSPAGAGLYFSAIIRPEPGADWVGLVTLAAGVAVGRAIETATALPVELKWPNDLVIGTPWRKLGGVLCETSGAAGSIDAIVVGVGINVRPAAAPSPLVRIATSIEAELGRPVERPVVFTEALAELAAAIARLRDGGRSYILAEWRRLARASLAGAPVRWDDRGRTRAGVTRDIDATGALVVDAGEGIERIVSGEVVWEL